MIFSDETIEQYFDRFGFSPQKDGIESYNISHWGTKETQWVNFNTTVKMLEGENVKSLLDIGCGLGDLSKFISQDIDYHGIDIFENVVKMAHDRNPNVDVQIGDIFKYNPDKPIRKYDAVVCNGAFNVEYGIDKIVEALKIMKLLANKVVILTISYADNDDIKQFRKVGFDIIPLKRLHDDKGDELCIIKWL